MGANLFMQALTVKSQLRYAIGAANTFIECLVADSSKFPTTYPYYLVIDADTDNLEVVKVTDLTDNTFTVTRGKLSTTAVAHPQSAKLELYSVISTNASGVGGGVGTYSSTVGDGISLHSATWINGFFADDAGANQAAGVRRNLISRTYFTIDQTTGGADYDVIRGHLKAASGIDFSGDTSTRTAIRGYSEFAGATTIGAGAFFASVLGELWVDGNLTGTGICAALLARIYGSTGSASGVVAGVAVSKWWNTAAGQIFTNGLYIQDGSVATGGDIRLQGGATISSGSAAPTHSATQGSLYLRTGQGINDTIYINTNGTTGWTLCDNVNPA